MSDQDERKLPPLHIDARDGGDWIKAGAWDLWKPGYTGLIDNVADMREHIAAMGMTVEQFKRLVVYRSHVDQPGFEWLREL